ncbi:MAG: hypothetical protein EA401_10980 [Planctomycetota bacterium]|nr:MAG: hypothetical protein EA401_10980 [Planctomycetota bacterium]
MESHQHLGNPSEKFRFILSALSVLAIVLIFGGCSNEFSSGPVSDLKWSTEWRGFDHNETRAKHWMTLREEAVEIPASPLSTLVGKYYAIGNEQSTAEQNLSVIYFSPRSMDVLHNERSIPGTVYSHKGKSYLMVANPSSIYRISIESHLSRDHSVGPLSNQLTTRIDIIDDSSLYIESYGTFAYHVPRGTYRLVTEDQAQTLAQRKRDLLGQAKAEREREHQAWVDGGGPQRAAAERRSQSSTSQRSPSREELNQAQRELERAFHEVRRQQGLD